MNSEPTSPASIAANMKAWAADIASALPALASGTLHDINDEDSPVVFLTGSPYHWSDLSSEGRIVQARLLEEYRRLSETLRALLSNAPDSSLSEFEKSTSAILRFINRDASSYSTPTQALGAATKILNDQVSLLDSLYSTTASTMLVPDTNALYWNTSLETWRVPWARGEFTVVLTPAVLREIDSHKNDDRRATRQQKAERFARQIGEYRRRGSLLQGVVLVRGVSSVLAMPLEPKMSESLPWLDASSADDRLVASTIEAMRRNSRTSVVVVTRDINLQNKLEFARIPFVSPEELGIRELA